MSLVWKRKVVMIMFINVYLFDISAGEKCQALEGTWFSDLGSELRLNHTAEGIILGDYISALDGELGSQSASGVQSDVIGAAPYNTPGAVFGFSVMWNSGASIKSWTGQCLMCGDDEVLETSWLLRQRVDGCSGKWLSTRIGQTLFTHKRPGGVPQTGRSKKDAISNGETMNRTNNICSLDGYWYNELGSEMLITVHEDTTVIGEYRTAVEREKGSAGTSHSKLYGVANEFDPNTTMALYVVWNNGASITGWVGQCHTCGQNQTETLMTTWLLRTKVASCDDNWKATLFGENTFTRHEQKRGPRKSTGVHTPGDVGEGVNGSNSILGKGDHTPHLLAIMCLSLLSIILCYTV